MTKHLILVQVLIPVVLTCGLVAATSVVLSLLFDNDSKEDDNV